MTFKPKFGKEEKSLLKGMMTNDAHSTNTI